MSISFPHLQQPLAGMKGYVDSRQNGYQGISRTVRMPRASAIGGGAISQSADGLRCAIAGKDSLRIVKYCDASEAATEEHRTYRGQGGQRLEATRNYWEGSGLKMDSANTDVAWARGVYSNKIMTSALNGELIMWDLNKAGPSKYERKAKDHSRTIHKVAVSHVVDHYCITGSADGDLRVWDLRDLQKSIMRIRHSASIRGLVFSPSMWLPLHAAIGLDNGSIFRWDLKMGQRGRLDWLPLAHTGSVTSLDWYMPGGSRRLTNGTFPSAPNESGLGWIASGSLDKTVKVWDLSEPSASAHIPNKPTYTLHTSFPIRKVAWRPDYSCELAIISNTEFGSGSDPDMFGLSSKTGGPARSTSTIGDPIEIWDVRRGYLPKWSMHGFVGEGGITDITFPASDRMFSLQSSGQFSQIDTRYFTKPLDTIARGSTSWSPSEGLLFIEDRPLPFEIPYDDVQYDGTTTPPRKPIGKAVYIPVSQNIGIIDTTFGGGADVFMDMALNYCFHERDRISMCKDNALCASKLGKEETAQTWMLLAANLEDIPSKMSTQQALSEPRTAHLAHVPQSQSAPSLNDNYTFPPTESSTPFRSRNASSAHRSTSATSMASIRTPNSSNSPSPHQHLSALPPITPISSRSQSGTPYLSRRQSNDPGIRSSAARRPSLYRRASVSVHSPSPSVSEKAGQTSMNHSTRHIGDGALDDSDSSGGSGDDMLPPRPNTATSSIPEDEVQGDLRVIAMTSPVLGPNRHPAHPSPLSRVAEHTGKPAFDRQLDAEVDHSDDEDDDERSDDSERSASPRSTDSESDNASFHSTQKVPSRSVSRKGKRVTPSGSKSRSRSSTLASLAAPNFRTQLTVGLSREPSHSSIGTVLAQDDFITAGRKGGGLRPEDTIRDLGMARQHQRIKSQTILETPLDLTAQPVAPVSTPINSPRSGRRLELIEGDETLIRSGIWDILRDLINAFADQGDVQMCAMMAMVAGEELNIPPRRKAAFVDAYTELLERLQLHVCAAEVRKWCLVEHISAQTQLETIIYTSCSRCKKPMVQTSTSKPSECSNCHAVVICTICSLPVRGLLFQCSVCAHGGHQLCYRRYYTQHPMRKLPQDPALLTNTGSSHVSSSNLTSSDDGSSTISTVSTVETVGERAESPAPQVAKHTLAGQLCAAGCGHYCWATNSG